MPAKPHAGYGLLAVSNGLESTRRIRSLGQCVRNRLADHLSRNQLGRKFLGKSPWRLTGSGVPFYFPLARVRTDRPGRNPPSFKFSHAGGYLESSTLSFPCRGIRRAA